MKIAVLGIGANVDVSFIEKILTDLRKMQPVPPASRDDES